ncbi:MAG TPA: MraY family glycosyltransferase [Chthonomonadaceae bacterium]|nr:MraY family glycosyltransferase [Chthonomonadaceae bacterium]
MYGIIVSALIAGLVTMALTPYVRRWAEKWGAIDQPEARRVNKAPMPRAGGVAIFLGILVAVLFTVTVRQFSRTGQHTWNPQVAGVLIALAFIAVVGLVDDLKNLSAKWQALAIFGAGLILVAFGVRIEGITNPLGGTIGLKYDPTINWHAFSTGISVLVTVVWVFIVTKTVDAIDGVDGLAAGVCAISAITLALMAAQLHTPEGPTLALMAAATTGACLGFLRYNYHPAKIIMGTVGAQVLGLMLAAISIMGAFKVAAAVSVLVPVLVLGVPIFDFTHVIARRLLARAPLTVADKRHLHHRLLDRGWSQPQVVWFIYSVALVLCITALAIFQARGR